MTEAELEKTVYLKRLVNAPYEFGSLIRYFLDRLPTKYHTSMYPAYIKDVLREDYHLNTDFTVKYEGEPARVILSPTESVDLLISLLITFDNNCDLLNWINSASDNPALRLVPPEVNALLESRGWPLLDREDMLHLYHGIYDGQFRLDAEGKMVIL